MKIVLAKGKGTRSACNTAFGDTFRAVGGGTTPVLMRVDGGTTALIRIVRLETGELAHMPVDTQVEIVEGAFVEKGAKYYHD